jgi:hypothetical protein
VRWFRIRKTEIAPELRDIFEERGLDTVRAIVVLHEFAIPRHDGKLVHEDELRPPMLRWLREQYDRAERKETWLITMEVAITLFVAAELFMSVVDFVFRYAK